MKRFLRLVSLTLLIMSTSGNTFAEEKVNVARQGTIRGRLRDLFLNFDAYKGKIVDAIGKSTVPIKAGDMAALRTMYNSDMENMNTVLENMVKRGTLTDEQITEIKEQRKS